MGILAPAIVGQFFLGEDGQEFVCKEGLRGGFHHGNGGPVEISHSFAALGAQIASAKQLKYAIADVGKTQVGDRFDLLGIEIHLEVVCHRFFPD